MRNPLRVSVYLAVWPTWSISFSMDSFPEFVRRSPGTKFRQPCVKALYGTCPALNGFVFHPHVAHLGCPSLSATSPRSEMSVLKAMASPCGYNLQALFKLNCFSGCHQHRPQCRVSALYRGASCIAFVSPPSIPSSWCLLVGFSPRFQSRNLGWFLIWAHDCNFDQQYCTRQPRNLA